MNARTSVGAEHGFHIVRRPDGWSGESRRQSPARGRDDGLSALVNGWIDMIAPAPWGAHVGLHAAYAGRKPAQPRRPLYTPDERARRDATGWTMVQAILAPLQFLVFAISLTMVIRYLVTGEGYAVATASILVKTVLLYTIMITGSVWEKVVFGRWLFAPSFFWEDVFSMLVLGLQTAYLLSLVFSWGSPREQMAIAMAAYAVYVVNAAQFVLKLRAARLEGAAAAMGFDGRVGGTA